MFAGKCAVISTLFGLTLGPFLPQARLKCPKSLVELLENPVYEKELATVGIPKARDKASKVLENVKKKGAKQGEFMSPEVEANLWPQIMQEAIAHQVVEAVMAVHRRSQSARGVNAAVLCAVSVAADLNRVHGGEDFDVPINEEFLPMVEEILGPEMLRGGAGGEGDANDDDQLPMEAVIGLVVVSGLPEERWSAVKATKR